MPVQLNAPAVGQSSVSGDGGGYEVATFDGLPNPATVTPGRVYTVLGNITGSAGGAYGTQWASNGAVWRPVGSQELWQLTAQADGISGGSTSEQRLAYALLPAGILKGCREIILRSRWLFSGADTNTRTLRARLGSSNSDTDAIIANGVAPATWRFAVLPLHASPDSTTGLQPTTNAGSANTPDTWTGSTTAQAVISVDLTAALYLGLTVQQGATPTATASLSRAWLIVS